MRTANYYQPLADTAQIIGGKELSAARINAAAAFIERSGIDVHEDWRFMDIELALFKAADHMEDGAALRQFANDVATIRRIRAKAHEAAA